MDWQSTVAVPGHRRVFSPRSPEDSSDFADFRKVNSVSILDSYPLPLIDNLIDTVDQATYVTKIDLQNGYNQIPLTKASREISAFVTPDGLYQYTRMPFGLSSVPATFQRLMNHVIRGLTGTFVYLDILIVAETWTEHKQRLSSLLPYLEQAGLTINLEK